MFFNTQNRSTLLLGVIRENQARNRSKSGQRVAPQVSSVLQTNGKGGNGKSLSDQSKKGVASKNRQVSKYVLSQPYTVGIIGGVSVYSTLVFLEKLIWWSLKDGGECPPFVLCNDTTQYKELPIRYLFDSLKKRKTSEIEYSSSNWSIIDSLCQKRAFLESSGARCIVMPCHVSHAWHEQISQDCSSSFLHAGECVAREIMLSVKPNLRGSNVRVGVLAGDATLAAGFYQQKLKNQGFEVVVPDKATMEHIVIPAIDTLKRRDMEGARNLLRIAVQVLLVRGANIVIVAADELQGVLPHEDPLLKKCIDPMDALARSTIKWARSTGNGG